MQILLIHDDNCKIYAQIENTFDVPVGLQHLIINVPEGKRFSRLEKVDGEITPVIIDIPPSETEILSQGLTEATMLIASQQEQIEMQNSAITELTMLVSMQMTGGNE